MRQYTSTLGPSEYGVSRNSGKSFTVTQQTATARITDREKPITVKSRRDYSGWRPPLPYLTYGSNYQNWVGAMELWGSYPYEINRYTGIVQSIMTPSYSVRRPPQNLVNRAVVEALNKAKEQDTNLAVAIAEMNRSATLLVTPLSAFATAYVAAKKGKWKTAAKALGIEKHDFKAGTNKLAQRWLELQYGWMPLLSDIDGIHKGAVTAFQRNALRLSVSRTIKVPIDESYSDPNQPEYNIVHTETGFYGVKVRLDYALTNSFAASASKYGLTNPAVIAWELVPFSFVVDWFVPLGNYLSAFDSTFGLSFIGGSLTLFAKSSRTSIAHVPTGPFKANKPKFGSAQSLSDSFYHGRSVYSSSPIPLPYWKPPVSVTHGLNLLALIRGKYR